MHRHGAAQAAAFACRHGRDTCGQRKHHPGGVGDNQRGTVHHGEETGRRRGVELVGQLAGHAGARVTGRNQIAGVRTAHTQRPGFADHRPARQLDRPGRDRCAGRRRAAGRQGRREYAGDGEIGLAIDQHQRRAFASRHEGGIGAGLDGGGEFGGNHVQRLDGVGVGHAAHGDGPALADCRDTAQGQAGDGWRHHGTREAAARLARRGNPGGAGEAGLGRICQHQRIAVDAGAKAGAGGVDPGSQAGCHFGQGNGGADHVGMVAGDRAAAVVETCRDGPGVAADRRAGELDITRVARHRIGGQRRRLGAHRDGGRKRVAGSIDDDQRHAVGARAEDAGRVGVDRGRQGRADGR